MQVIYNEQLAKQPVLREVKPDQSQSKWIKVI